MFEWIKKLFQKPRLHYPYFRVMSNSFKTAEFQTEPEANQFAYEEWNRKIDPIKIIKVEDPSQSAIDQKMMPPEPLEIIPTNEGAKTYV